MTISKSLYKQLRLLFQPIIREVGDGKILLPPKELYGELRAMDKDEYLQILVSQINEFIGNEGVYPTFEQVNEMLADYRTADEQDVIDNTKADNSRFPVQSHDIANGAVIESKLGNFSVTKDKIFDRAVTTDKIANNAVTTDKIAYESVTIDKLTPTIQDKINDQDTFTLKNKPVIDLNDSGVWVTVKSIEILTPISGDYTTGNTYNLCFLTTDVHENIGFRKKVILSFDDENNPILTIAEKDSVIEVDYSDITDFNNIRIFDLANYYETVCYAKFDIYPCALFTTTLKNVKDNSPLITEKKLNFELENTKSFIMLDDNKNIEDAISTFNQQN